MDTTPVFNFKNMLKKLAVIFGSLVAGIILLVKKVAAQIVLPDPSVTHLSNTPVIDIITNVMQWFLGIVGFIAIISFCISGIIYFTAAGNEETAKNAKKALTYSILGVVVALSGFVIIRAVDIMMGGVSPIF